jgi:hypothetical protein
MPRSCRTTAGLFAAIPSLCGFVLQLRMKEPPDQTQGISEGGQPPMLPAGYHGDDRWLLLLAAVIGVVGGLATVAFHEGMAFTERIATGLPGSWYPRPRPWRRGDAQSPRHWAAW